MTHLICRDLTATDLNKVAALDPNHSADDAWLQHQRGEVLCAVAELGGEIVAFVVLDYSDGEWQPELRNLLVAKSHRRQGVGAALSRYLEHKAKEKGFGEVFAAGPIDNAAATALFVGMDYLPTGQQRTNQYTYVGDNGQLLSATDVEVIYRKSLARA